MARSTVANTIERTRRQLNSSIRHEVNELAANIDATANTVTLEYELSAAVQIGTILSIGDELMRVVGKNAGAKEVTVIRGWLDSDGAAHVDGDEVLISPRFTRKDLYEGIIEEITSWSPALFRVVSYEWTVTDEDETVELPAVYDDAIGIVTLRRQWGDETDSSAWPEIGFRLMRGTVGVWTPATTSGMLVRLLPNHGIMRAGTIHAEIALPFDVTTSTLLESEDLVADYGLDYSMLEVVDLGVKMRVMADAENSRSGRFAQDEPRRPDEVAAGAALTVAQTIRANYQRRMGDEVRKLQRRYKPRAW